MGSALARWAVDDHGHGEGVATVKEITIKIKMIAYFYIFIVAVLLKLTILSLYFSRAFTRGLFLEVCELKNLASSRTRTELNGNVSNSNSNSYFTTTSVSRYIGQLFYFPLNKTTIMNKD